MKTPLGLLLAFLAACAVNWAYAREHDAAAAMPPFSPRHPLRIVAALLADRGWLLGFAAEGSGWLVYLGALRLAPLALVQAVGASGIAVLALASVHGQLRRLSVRERLTVASAVGGLVLLALSLLGTPQPDHAPGLAAVLAWLACSVGGALVLMSLGRSLARGPALGLAAGLLFAGGDISAKLVVFGGVRFAAVGGLIVCYALGSGVLQRAFQESDALTAAGLATLASNAVPIAAGFVLFGERLPGGVRGALQLAGFCGLVASAAFLGRGRPSPGAAARERAAG